MNFGLIASRNSFGPEMFALLEACRLKACAVNDAAELQAVKPARMMEMASVHVGVDNDYSVISST